jgi:hypothetical protein
VDFALQKYNYFFTQTYFTLKICAFSFFKTIRRAKVEQENRSDRRTAHRQSCVERYRQKCMKFRNAIADFQ